MEQPWRLQGWWYALLGLLLVLGLVLVSRNPQLPSQVQQISTRVRPGAWSRLLGIYLLSSAVTHLVAFYSARVTAVLLNLRGPETIEDLWSPTLVGICESVMYPTALIIQKAEFIGVWLAVKVAGQWVRWAGEAGKAQEAQAVENLNEGRRRFNRFLVGNALSIIAAVATYAALKIWALK